MEPKRIALAQAESDLSVAVAELDERQAELKIVQDALAALQEELRLTMEKKDKLVSDVKLCAERLERAEKLIKGLGGKYSKRRRSNVAVIIVRIVFISSFLFYCLLLNHSFPTNPNRITNCFKLFSLLQLTTTLLLRHFLIFEQVKKYDGENLLKFYKLNTTT